MADEVSGEFRSAMGTVERQAETIGALRLKIEQYEHMINDLHNDMQALKSTNELLMSEKADAAAALQRACDVGNRAKDEAIRAIQQATELRSDNERLRKDLEAARAARTGE
jgi:chromosome segregation ATPase